MGYERGIPYGQAAVHLFPGGSDDGRLTEPALSQHFLWFIHFILPTSPLVKEETEPQHQSWSRSYPGVAGWGSELGSIWAPPFREEGAPLPPWQWLRVSDRLPSTSSSRLGWVGDRN